MVDIRFGGKKSISERFGRVRLLADLLLCTKPLITRTNLSDRRVFLPPSSSPHRRCLVPTLRVRKENLFLGRGNGKTHFIVRNQPFHSLEIGCAASLPVHFFFGLSFWIRYSLV